MTAMRGVVYLLHFERPISNGHTCQHYLGWCLDLDARIAAHRAGRGARLTQVAIERGIDFEVVATWAGDRTVERRLKNRKESPRLCPICFPRQRPVQPAEQLALNLDDADDWIEPADLPAVATRMDRYEFLWHQRLARPAAPDQAEDSCH